MEVIRRKRKAIKGVNYAPQVKEAHHKMEEIKLLLLQEGES